MPSRGKILRPGCIRLGFLTIALVTSTGCASLNEDLLQAQKPIAPAQWRSDLSPEGDNEGQTALNAAPIGDWLAAFEDSALRGLVSEAMQQNKALLNAAANFDAATQNAKIVRAALFPNFGINANAARSAIVTDPSTAAQSGGGSGGDLSGLGAGEIEDRFGIDVDGDGNLDGLDVFDGPPENQVQGQDGVVDSPLPNRRIYINNYQTGAQLSWELDLWGRVSDDTRAAYKDARASMADLQGLQLSIASGVAQNWYALVAARLQRELAERDVAARTRNLNVIERRYTRGVASSLDVRLARSALGSSEAGLAQRQQEEREASRRLEVLLGRYPAAEIDSTQDLPSLGPLAGAGAPGDLLARRPDIIAAELRMEAAGLRARAARKQILPTLTLSSSLNTSGPELSDLIDPERLAGNIAGGLFQPVFQGGRIRANIKSQRARAEASLYAYAQTALEAYEEAENALAADGFLALRENALKTAFEEAAAGEAITERRYAQGAATIFNLLDAQTRRISAESSFIRAKQLRLANRVQLYAAIGGDFLTLEQLNASQNTEKMAQMKEAAQLASLKQGAAR